MTEIALREASDALFQHATEGILVTDQQGKIARINPAAEKLFGYSTGELLGQKVEVLIPRDLRESHVQQRTGYAGNPHQRAMGQGLNLRAVRRDGTTFPVEVSLSPYESGGEKFFIAFILDISARLAAEEQLRSYSSDLEEQVQVRTRTLESTIRELELTQANLHEALQKERELNEMKSRFVTLASHEFRTPLSTMMSSLSLIERYAEKNDLENQQKHIRKIRSSINNLTDILNDFLSVSKLEEGKIEFQPQPADIHHLLQSTLDEMSSVLGPNQHLQFDYTGSLTGNIDVKLLKNVVVNLVSNAIKFSPSNGRIAVNAENIGGFLKVRFIDRGKGIPESEKQHLFTRFFRATNATHIQGTGLGLSIVQKYLEIMGGSIEITSEENIGTTVQIIVPLAQ